MSVDVYPKARDAFLRDIQREQAVLGARIRDYLIEHYPGNNCAAGYGHDLLRGLHQALVIMPVFAHPAVLASAPQRDKDLYRSAMAFQTLQYTHPVKSLAAKDGEPPVGSHEFYTWARGRRFARYAPPKPPREPAEIERDGWIWAWCPNADSRVREIEDCRGEAYCVVCNTERVPVTHNGRLARHRYRVRRVKDAWLERLGDSF